ncbi:hypothetical protein [Aquimarina sp. 2304DJ70-9]|uniref:hypothetical protein n=1 Tax=Aquimarina penaris TaxID=3231044 RepID=UPI00346263C1
MKTLQTFTMAVLIVATTTMSAQKCDPTACKTTKEKKIVMVSGKMSSSTSNAGIAADGNQKSINDSDYVLIDLVVLNMGYGEKDRAAYSKKTAKIASKYQLKKAQSYGIQSHLAGMGPKNAFEFNLWTMPSPTSMAALGQDPAYQANVPNRDKIHDMKALTLFLARPKTGFGGFTPKDGKSYLLDFVIMNEGAGALQRSIYNSKVRKIAKKHNVDMVASFDVLQELGGAIHNVLEVNIWEMDSPASMKALGVDAEYQANIEFRNQIHNMQDLTLYMANAKR